MHISGPFALIGIAPVNCQLAHRRRREFFEARQLHRCLGVEETPFGIEQQTSLLGFTQIAVKQPGIDRLCPFSRAFCRVPLSTSAPALVQDLFLASFRWPAARGSNRHLLKRSMRGPPLQLLTSESTVTEPTRLVHRSPPGSEISTSPVEVSCAAVLLSVLSHLERQLQQERQAAAAEAAGKQTRPLEQPRTPQSLMRQCLAAELEIRPTTSSISWKR